MNKSSSSTKTNKKKHFWNILSDLIRMHNNQLIEMWIQVLFNSLKQNLTDSGKLALWVKKKKKQQMPKVNIDFNQIKTKGNQPYTLCMHLVLNLWFFFSRECDCQKPWSHFLFCGICQIWTRFFSLTQCMLDAQANHIANTKIW